MEINKSDEQEMSNFKLRLDREPQGVQQKFYGLKNELINKLVKDKITRNLNPNEQQQLLDGVINGGDLEEIKNKIISQERNLHANQIPDVDFEKMASDQDRAGHWTGGAVD